MHPEKVEPPEGSEEERMSFDEELVSRYDFDLSSRWSLLALLNREGLGSGITNSPIVERTSAYALVTSLSYNF